MYIYTVKHPGRERKQSTNYIVSLTRHEMFPDWISTTVFPYWTPTTLFPWPDTECSLIEYQLFPDWTPTTLFPWPDTECSLTEYQLQYNPWLNKYLIWTEHHPFSLNEYLLFPDEPQLLSYWTPTVPRLNANYSLTENQIFPDTTSSLTENYKIPEHLDWPPALLPSGTLTTYSLLNVNYFQTWHPLFTGWALLNEH